MIDLSILIVNYNNENYLKDCLTSIYNSTRRLNLEIIFIDNNSSDNSIRLVSDNFTKVKIIKNSENLGFCKANNQGLKIYRGRHALLLNTDTIVKNGALDEMVRFMDTHPEVGACGPKLLNPNGTLQHQGGLFSRRFWRSRRPIPVDYVLGACLMVKRKVIGRVGGLDENFFFSNDDLDWCRRIRKAGWDVCFVPRAEVIHYGGFTTRRFSQKPFIEGFRGGLYFCKKHYGNLAYQIYRFLLAFSMLAAILFSGLFYPMLKNKSKLMAFIQILKIAIKGQIYPGHGKILFVSNGHAEDLTAASIAAKLLQNLPDLNLKGLPLVGMGKAYEKSGIKNLSLGTIMPSGGFAKEGLRYLFKDLRAGLFPSLFKQIRILKAEAATADLIVCMGDVFLVAPTGFFTKKPIIFIDGPNSVRIRKYYAIEKWILKKYCKKVIVQDEETAQFLKKSNIDGIYLGTWVMDYVELTAADFGIDKDKIIIGMLPGTREEAYSNFILILEVFADMAKRVQENEKFMGLAASVLDQSRLKEKLKTTPWQFQETSPQEKEKGITAKLTSPSGAAVLVAEGKFGDVCKASKLILGLAGIANEQAVGLGTPVVAFPGYGPQTTQRRWKEIHHITGDSMAILKGSVGEIAQQTLEILRDSNRLREMSQIGLASKKDQGAIKRIADLVVKYMR